jgi:hypothetical protein
LVDSNGNSHYYDNEEINNNFGKTLEEISNHTKEIDNIRDNSGAYGNFGYRK